MTVGASALQLKGETQPGLESEFIKVVSPDERGAGFNRNDRIFGEMLSDQNIQRDSDLSLVRSIGAIRFMIAGPTL
jgi:hypothetical protein